MDKEKERSKQRNINLVVIPEDATELSDQPYKGCSTLTKLVVSGILLMRISEKQHRAFLASKNDKAHEEYFHPC